MIVQLRLAIICSGEELKSKIIEVLEKFRRKEVIKILFNQEKHYD